MIVVSDTSAISNLLTIHEAELLRRLFDQVVVPPAVMSELRRFHSRIPDFVTQAAPSDRAWICRMLNDLHIGEAEAICLARELSADRLLIDEKRGRHLALREGVKIVGVVGVLIAAKESGFIPEVASRLRALEERAGFRLGRRVKEAALRAVREL